MARKKIDLLLPPAHRTGYGVLPHFTRAFKAALEGAGAQCRLLGNESGLTPELGQQLMSSPPDCTVSFNGLLPDSEGRFLCEVLKIPHFAFLVDSPNHFFPLLRSPLTMISCIDRDWVNFFRSFKTRNVFFLPHAVEEDAPSPMPTTCDAVFLGTCFDPDGQRSQWKKKYGAAITEVLDTALEIAFSDESIPYFEAFMGAMNQRMQKQGDIRPGKSNIPELLEELELAIRGIDRLKLLRAITDAQVHVYGGKSGTKGWSELLQGTSHVVHDAVPYTDALQVIRQSKFVLNSCPSIRDGAHERIFTAFLSGAAVVTNVSSYVLENFAEGEEVLIYRHQDYAAINQSLSQLLQNEPARLAMVERAKQKTLATHTWDQRAKTLLQYLDRTLPDLEAEK